VWLAFSLSGDSASSFFFFFDDELEVFSELGEFYLLLCMIDVCAESFFKLLSY
jgi:hypothetical protein